MILSQSSPERSLNISKLTRHLRVPTPDNHTLKEEIYLTEVDGAVGVGM
ncbi:hypothetical protein AM1_1012 [Acaryochloris marina MBIC11017]|uniref:Uncharacterized protein n=1 Tax=Acaryochloris marina (strain MBIC 11017) TaxID=329726 RepID=B0C0S8_ACAM1|nr:hypothetical protein AM1_1012 [Acaryochloris marina MBIC11017]